MKKNTYCASILIMIAVCSFQYSCKEAQLKQKQELTANKSVIGYYKNSVTSATSKISISLTFKTDSSVLYLTDYNNFVPEIVLRGSWSMDEDDSSVVKIKFNDEIMRFRKSDNKIDLIENHNFGKVGLTELQLVRTVNDSAIPKTLIMWVASSYGNCDTTGKKKCLRVRWGDNDQGNYFVFKESVTNFSYQEGIKYKLKIERTLKPGLPSDSIAYLYELKEQLLSSKDSLAGQKR